MLDGTLLTLPLVLLAGIVSFASPCFLPVVPVFVGFLVGGPEDGQVGAPGRRRTAAAQAVVFVLGFTCVFVAMWASIGLLGHVLGAYRPVLRVAGGAIIVVLGLHVAGLIDLPFLQRQRRIPTATVLAVTAERPDTRPAGRVGAAGTDAAGVATAARSRTASPATARPTYRRSLLLGLAFGAGWTPCIGPILGAVLGLASSGDSVAVGATLLLTYCLGLGIPFVLIAVGATAVHARMRRLAAHQGTVSMISGALLVALGFAIITDLFGRLTGLLPAFG